MCSYVCFTVMAVLLVTALARLSARAPGGMGLRALTLFGALVALGSWMFLPWVKFSPAGYLLNGLPEVLSDYAPEFLAHILELLRKGGLLSHLLSLLASIAGVPAPILLLLALLASSSVSGGYLWISLALILPPIVSIGSLIWLAMALLATPSRSADAAPGRSFGLRRRMAVLQVTTSVAAAVLLLSQMPVLDALGTQSLLFPRFLMVIGGVQMSRNVWLAWLGLILIVLGGLYEGLTVSVSATRPAAN